MTQNSYQGPPVNQPWTQNPANQPSPQGQGQGQYPQDGYQQPHQHPQPSGQVPPPQGAPGYGYPAQPPQGNPFQQAGPAGAPAQPGGDDPFSTPPVPQGGGDSPGIHQLSGRLLLIRPYSIDPNAAGFQGGRPGPLVMANLIVCDGPPIEGNLNAVTEQFTPFASGPKQTPFYCGGMYIRGAVMPGQLEPFVGSRGQVLGRLIKGNPGKEGKPPWLLADPTEADKVLGRQIHAQWDQIQANGQQVRPDQFAAASVPQQAPQQWQQPVPGGNPNWPQQPAPQGPPPNWGQPPAQPQYAAPQGGQQAPQPGGQQWPPAEQGAPPAQQWPDNGQPPYPQY